MVRPPLPTTAPGLFEGINMDVFGLAAALGEVFFVLLSPGKIAAGSGFLAAAAGLGLLLLEPNRGSSSSVSLSPNRPPPPLFFLVALLSETSYQYDNE